MSISASIDITLKGQKTSSIEIIKVLIASGWSLTTNGYTSYLPLGDQGNFNWQSTQNINFDKLTQIFTAKEAANEIVGILLQWHDTEIGGDFLFWPAGSQFSLSLNININRQKLALNNNYETTNFQWYLEKLLPTLNDVFGIEYFSCEQHS